MGMQLPQLDEAIAALAANQPDLVLRDLQAATTDLEKMRDMAKSLQQLQQQMAKMGKDLAEQLKNGQPEAAQQTMNKMIDQLKSANLSPEQLQKMAAGSLQRREPGGKLWRTWPSTWRRPQRRCSPGIKLTPPNRWPMPPKSCQSSCSKWAMRNRSRRNWTL